MTEAANNIIMNMDMNDVDSVIPQGQSVEEVRQDRKNKLSAALRLFGKFGFAEGVAGHITVRDPGQQDHFWVNPMGKSFKQMKVSDLLLVSHTGEVVEGSGLLNGAAPSAAQVREGAKHAISKFRRAVSMKIAIKDRQRSNSLYEVL